MKKQKRIILFGGFLALALAGHAQKIDFNAYGRNVNTVTEPGFTPWAIEKLPSVSMTLDNGITITLNNGGQENTTLKSNQWKDGVEKLGSKIINDAAVLYGFDGDGNTPHLTASGTLNVVIEGLPAGQHSLLAYHNCVDGGTPVIAKLDVAVNGTTVLTGVTQTQRELLPSSGGQSYVTFTAVEGQPVTISYTSRAEADVTMANVYINALVFDQPNPKTTALDPVPANNDIHVDGDKGSIGLSWTMASSAVSNRLYIGTSEDNMALVAELPDNKYVLDNVYSMNTYYWRVDEVDASGNAYKGDVWTFRPRQLAFPGAEGYGRYATGGRGGVVYHVTSLDDYSDGEAPIQGTFRYGIKEVKGPRTIVFDVAGTITLRSRLTCPDPYVTIAGQTAPGKGILFRTSPFGMASEGITRFIRMRLGYHNGNTERGLDGLGMAGNNHAIMDHCSVGWTIDEAFSSRNAHNITLQRTLISEALNVADHPNYGSGTAHGYAATIGGDTGSYHHNLLAHNEGRNWSMSGGLDGGGSYAGHHDMFNNVCYNWGGRSTDGGTHQGQFVNNYYKMGPATRQRVLLNAQLEGTGNGSQSYYVSGNIRENLDGSRTEDKYGDTYRYSLSGGQQLNWEVFVDKPFFESHATVEPARLAFKTVLSDVGCNSPVLDDHDVRMVDETLKGTFSCVGSKSGKKGLIDREADAGGYENYPVETRPADFDTDGDGMPDWWEALNGTDPNTADNNRDDNRDGWTALEDYLNWLAEPHFTVVAGTESTIDLKKLFAGFDNNPVFEVDYDNAAIPEGYTAEVDGMNLVVGSSANAGRLLTIPVMASDDDKAGVMKRNINLHISSGTTGIDAPLSIGSGSDAVYRIYTVDGVLVRNGRDMSGLAPGIYLLKAVSGSKVHTFKVTKK